MSRSSICGSGFDSITECLFCLLICCFCLFYNLRDVLVVHSYRSPLLLNQKERDKMHAFSRL